MRKRKRQAETSEHNDRLSAELGWLEAVAAHGGEISFGAPMRCPDCADFCLAESVTGGVQHNRCVQCGLEWTLSTKAIALFRHASIHEDAAVVGSGVLTAGLDVKGLARMTRERFTDLRTALHTTGNPAYHAG